MESLKLKMTPIKSITFVPLFSMELSSKLLQQAVEAFSTLPGIGKRSALRMVLHLTNQPAEKVSQFAHAIERMRLGIKNCSVCHNLSDDDVCSICTDTKREQTVVCVVESIRDVMAVEETGQFRGVYHVLGGVINPIEGIGPEQLEIESLVARVDKQEIEELIMAISPTIEGDTTLFYLSNLLKNKGIKISTIARGVSFGGELEYADGITLGRSILARRPYDQQS